MVFKYYTADVKVFGDNELQTPSITIKVWFWNNPLDAVVMMKNQLELWGMEGHKVFNIRRIN